MSQRWPAAHRRPVSSMLSDVLMCLVVHAAPPG
jgi:hypothetical protein